MADEAMAVEIVAVETMAVEPMTDEIMKTMAVETMVVETSKLCFTLNGKLVEVDNPDPQQLLVHYLRQSGHTGTKVLSP